MLLSTDLIAKKQHDAVRTTAGWYYFTHHLIEVTGREACALLDYIYTGAVAKVAVDKKDIVEQVLAAREEEFGAIQITEIDVMAYSLATEKGFVLVTDIDQSTPFEVDMYKGINWDKDFIGKETFLAVKDQPPKHKLVGITVEDKGARVHGGPKGAPVYRDGKLIGRVTKFTYGFTVDKYVGFALIDAGTAEIGDRVILNNGTVAEITNHAVIECDADSQIEPVFQCVQFHMAFDLIQAGLERGTVESSWAVRDALQSLSRYFRSVYQ